MWHLVLVMNYSVLGRELSVGECCVNIVTGTGLSEVYHRDSIACLNKSHASQLGKCSTQTVTSHFECISRVKLLKTSDLSMEPFPN